MIRCDTEATSLRSTSATYAVSSGVSFRCRRGVSFGCRLTPQDGAHRLHRHFRRTLDQDVKIAAATPGRRRPPGWQSPRRAERECAPAETPGAAAAATATTARPSPPRRPPCRAATAPRTDTARIRGRRSGSQAAAGRVGSWRAAGRVRWFIRRFRAGPQSGSPGHVSSSRLVKPSMPISGTGLSCCLPFKVYVAVHAGSAFGR